MFKFNSQYFPMFNVRFNSLIDMIYFKINSDVTKVYYKGFHKAAEYHGQI